MWNILEGINKTEKALRLAFTVLLVGPFYIARYRLPLLITEFCFLLLNLITPAGYALYLWNL